MSGGLIAVAFHAGRGWDADWHIRSIGERSRFPAGTSFWGVGVRNSKNLNPLRHVAAIARIFALFFVFPTLCLAQDVRFGPDHYEKLIRLSEPAFSPDGKSLVLTVRRPNFTDNKWESEIHRIEVGNGRSTPFTSGRKTARMPRWSPKGDRVAFLAVVDGKAQILVQPGEGGEAKQITRSPTGVTSYAWSRDGKHFAYTASDEAPKRAPNDDAFYAGENDYLMTKPAVPLHAWTIPAEGGDARRLTSGDWSINKIASAIDWSSDDTRVLFTNQPTAGSRALHRRAAGTVRVDGSGVTPIAGTALCSSQGFSPDGRWIGLICPVDGQQKNQTELVTVPADGGALRPLSRTIDRNFMRAKWAPDGATLVATAPDAGATGLWTFPMDGNPRRWTLGSIYTTGDLDVASDGRVVFVGKTSVRPDELYIVTSPDREPVRLTDFQTGLDTVRFGKAETIYWTSDGMPFSGVVTYPPDFDPKRKYPLVLFIHGGPWFSSRVSFVERVQLLAAQGWIVFQPNYRGSDNYGNVPFSAVYRDHGAGPGRDVMAGLEALKSRGSVDASRIGISGWSYGGYMTAWLIGHYPGWKAAIAGAAVIDLGENYALNDLNLYERAYGETLTMPADLALQAEQSPITYVDAITTPLLLVATTGDTRVPVTQTYRLFRALKERNRDVRLLLYPVNDHVPDDPVRSRDIDRKWVEWFAERLGDSAARVEGRGESKDAHP